VRQNLERELGRDPTDATLGKAMNMTAAQVRRHMEIGHAARNKLIKVTSSCTTFTFRNGLP